MSAEVIGPCKNQGLADTEVGIKFAVDADADTGRGRFIRDQPNLQIAVINDGIIQQIGTPMDLYDQPANLFVANFLGVANVVAGNMAAEDGKMIFRSSDGAVTVPVVEGAQGTGSIIFRPQNLTIQPQDAEPISGAVQLSGTVDHKEFLGSVVRYQVAVGGQLILVDAPHQRGEKAMPEGTDVSLSLSGDHVIGLAK